MDNRRRRRAQAIELGKDVLIVLLTCSALWMLSRGQLLGRLDGLWQEEDAWAGTVQSATEARVDAARPMSVTANLFRDGSKTARYGVQYDAAAADALFQQVAGLLVEALSSAGAPEPISRAQWEQSLSESPGVTFDFLGELPMPVLTGWLAGENAALDGAVRRLTLSVWQDKVALYYRNEEDGRTYRSLSEVANRLHLTEALSSLSENGAVYAFELEQYRTLDPDTLLLEAAPAPALYSASNPMNGGRASLEGLMETLGLPIDASSFYATGAEHVAKMGSESIRLSERGRVIYEAAGPAVDRFPVSLRRDGASLFETVETCRWLAAATVGDACGEARLYLISAKEEDEGVEVRFGYSLNGAAVQLDQGDAASFTVRNGHIVGFELNFRSYTDSGQRSAVMPVRQAVAAMGAMELEGEELLLLYGDNGGDAVSAAWVAVESPRNEEE